MAVPPTVILMSAPVSCPACAWSGELADARLEPNELARCPECGVAVEVERESSTSA